MHPPSMKISYSKTISKGCFEPLDFINNLVVWNEAVIKVQFMFVYLPFEPLKPLLWMILRLQDMSHVDDDLLKKTSSLKDWTKDDFPLFD